MELQPFDNQELPPTIIELKLEAKFFKAQGQPAQMNIQIFEDENRKVDPANMGMIILGALFHWCKQVTPKPGAAPIDLRAAANAQIMLPHLEKIMDEIKLVNPERSLNKLFDENEGNTAY